MADLSILFPSVLNGLTTGAVYALIALGLTLVYGVLHIINFAHGAALMLALYGVYYLKQQLGIDPYLALPIMVPAMFALGYCLQGGLINRAGHGKDENVLLVTLLIPPVAAVLGWAVLGERLGWPHAAGMALIALGFAVMDGRLRRRS